MSKIVIALMLLVNVALAQINLVPNGGFELYDTCPNLAGQITRSINWLNFRGTPDYYHSCSINGVSSMPNTLFGYQPSHSGNGMAGIEVYNKTALNFREVIGYSLIQPLGLGQKYYVSFYINKCSHQSFNLGANNIGVSFSMNAYSNSNPAPIVNNAFVFSDTIVTDIMGWYKVQGSFIATQNFQFMMLGNFFDDGHTDTLQPTPNSSSAYYFIDDICISTDSVYCSTFTNFISYEYEKNAFVVKYSPSEQQITITIKYPELNSYLKIYSTIGQLCKYQQLSKETLISISTTDFIQGLYVVEIITPNKAFRKKILVHF